MKKIPAILAAIILVFSLMSCATEEASQTLNENGASKEQTLTVKGTYQGLQDNNTFEVQLSSNTYKVFEITEDIRADFEKLNLKNGDKVEVAYRRGPSSTLQVISIRLTENSKENNKPDNKINKKTTVTGKYIGLADDNFFEVLVDNPEAKEYKVFMITEAVRSVFNKLKLQKNDPVRISYAENNDGQLEVQNIERTEN